MTEWIKDDDPTLDVEITRLRNALGELRVPADDEAKLRAAFRARPAVATAEPRVAVGDSRHLSHASGSRALRRRRAIFVAGALAASFAVAAVSLVGFGRIDRDVGESVVAAPATTVKAGAAFARAGTSSGEREMPTTAAFQPLLYSPGISPAQSYNVVRVRIPLTSLVGYDAPLDGTIEADVLVGEDGLARGIRFDTTDAQLVSMASQ